MKRLLLILAGTLPFCAAAEPGAKPDLFPLTNHSWWEYSGTAKLRGNPGTQPIRIRMDVIEVLERGAVKAAWVRGSPLGLMNHTEGPDGQVIARVGQRMYVADAARSSEVRLRMGDPADSLADLFRDSEFLLDTALPVDDTVCAKDELTQQCRGKSPSAPACNSCWSTSMAGNEYRITQRGPAGFRTIRFQPGAGITGFEFENVPMRESASVRLDASDVVNPD
jgi:hypothetical protein